MMVTTTGLASGATSWTDAEAAVVALGGHLVAIKDAAEQQFLSNEFGSQPHWIGFNDAAMENTFVWSSGDPVTYTNWAFGEPNDFGSTGEDYAVMNWNSLGNWNDLPDDNLGTHRGIIEWVPPAGTRVEVKNLAPTIGAGPSETLSPALNGSFSRTGMAFTDPGTLDVHTVEVDWDGDAVADESFTVTPAGTNVRTFDLNHTYTTEGTFTVTVWLEDDDSGVATDSFEVTVDLNDPPTAADNTITTNEDTTYTFMRRRF